MRLDSPLALRVGVIGEVAFKAGHYVYSGSARRNLSQRISRHMRREKKLHWHIDYVTCREEVSIESVYVFPPDPWTECGLNSVVQRLRGTRPVEGFGCSDCRCLSHLTFLGETPLPSHLEPHVTHERL